MLHNYLQQNHYRNCYAWASDIILWL